MEDINSVADLIKARDRLIEESERIQDEVIQPSEKSALVTMFKKEGTRHFMIRGGEFPPSTWDHDCIIAAMRNALREKKRFDFLSGPLLCVGSIDHEGKFCPSRFLTEFVLPNISSGKLSFYIKNCRKRKPKTESNPHSRGYFSHKGELHDRSSETEMYTHVHKNHLRRFRYLDRDTDSKGQINEIRYRFGKVLANPKRRKYKKLSVESQSVPRGRHVDEVGILDLENQFIFERRGGKGHPYYVENGDTCDTGRKRFRTALTKSFPDLAAKGDNGSSSNH